MTITKGIYICANEPTEPSADMFLEPGSFNSNNENACFEIQYNSSTRKLYYNTFGDDSYEVYNYVTKTWTNNAWKTIDIISTNSAGNDWFFANYTRQQLSIDLTTLPGWANLSTGNHTIKIKAKGTGYKESELSAGVVVSKAASTVTLEAGTYLFANTPTFNTIPRDEDGHGAIIVEEFNFKSNAIAYDGINITISFTNESNNSEQIVYYEFGDQLLVYDKSVEDGTITSTGWDDTTNRTIIIETDQQVSAEFYKWAITDGNLVKQTSETWVLNEQPTITPAQDGTYSIAFTSNNTTYSTFKILFPIGNTGVYYDSTKVYDGDAYSWANQAYRTVTFDTAPTGDLLAWLQANGVKQVTEKR